MREKFKTLPEPLQKHIMIRAGASLVSLLLFITVVLLYRDLYLSIAFVMFFLFFGISGFLLLIRVFEGKYVAIEGNCTKVEKTPIRKRPKTLYFSTEVHTVKLQLHQKLKNISVGDSIVVYAAENAPVYQDEGCQILSGYIAIEIRKRSD